MKTRSQGMNFFKGARRSRVIQLLSALSFVLGFHEFSASRFSFCLRQRLNDPISCLLARKANPNRPKSVYFFEVHGAHRPYTRIWQCLLGESQGPGVSRESELDLHDLDCSDPGRGGHPGGHPLVRDDLLGHWMSRNGPKERAGGMGWYIYINLCFPFSDLFRFKLELRFTSSFL